MLMIAIYIASIFILGMLPIPIIFKIMLVGILTVYMVWMLRKYCLLMSPSSIQSLRYINPQKWVLVTRSGEAEAELLGDSTATRWVSVLRFNIHGKQRPVSCVVFSDSLTGDMYRKLMVSVRL